MCTILPGNRPSTKRFLSLNPSRFRLSGDLYTLERPDKPDNLAVYGDAMLADSSELSVYTGPKRPCFAHIAVGTWPAAKLPSADWAAMGSVGVSITGSDGRPGLPAVGPILNVIPFAGLEVLPTGACTMAS